MEISEEILGSNTGLEAIISRLDEIYLKDELSEKYNAIEKFEMYRRSSDITIREFLTEFDQLHFKVKSYQFIYILGFRLLKSVNFDTMNEQLVKATITDLTYTIVKEKLVKIFSDDHKTPTTPNEIKIKEETFYCQDQQDGIQQYHQA